MLWLFLVFEIRKNFDLRKILVTPQIFLKSRFHCNSELRSHIRHTSFGGKKCQNIFKIRETYWVYPSTYFQIRLTANVIFEPWKHHLECKFANANLNCQNLKNVRPKYTRDAYLFFISKSAFKKPTLLFGHYFVLNMEAFSFFISKSLRWGGVSLADLISSTQQDTIEYVSWPIKNSFSNFQEKN